MSEINSVADRGWKRPDSSLDRVLFDVAMIEQLSPRAMSRSLITSMFRVMPPSGGGYGPSCRTWIGISRRVVGCTDLGSFVTDDRSRIHSPRVALPQRRIWPPCRHHV